MGFMEEVLSWFGNIEKLYQWVLEEITALIPVVKLHKNIRKNSTLFFFVIAETEESQSLDGSYSLFNISGNECVLKDGRAQFNIK